MNGRGFSFICLAWVLAATANAAGGAPVPVTDNGNLLGNLTGTLQVARSPDGGIYPPGSVIQLVPTEVMVKQPRGFNAATHDWEFFELNVSKEGASINKRGFSEVINRFGGNCLACHIKAQPKWDFICETGHGCDPIPLTQPMLKALQELTR